MAERQSRDSQHLMGRDPREVRREDVHDRGVYDIHRDTRAAERDIKVAWRSLSYTDSDPRNRNISREARVRSLQRPCSEYL